MNSRPQLYTAGLIRLFVCIAAIFSIAGELQAQRVPVERPEQELRRRQEEYDSSRQRPRREEFNEDVRGRQEWFYFQRRYPYDMIPAGARAAAIAQTKDMEQKMEAARKRDGRSLLAAARWEEIGPVNIGGRIPALAVHPTQAGTIYVGAASGGVWKTTDGGSTWNTTFDKQSSLTVGALAIDRSNPNVIYAGTGESYRHTEDYFGDGLFKSTDGGATWRNIGMRNVGGFSELYVHPGNSAIIYALASKENGGFYRSTDSGATWTRTLTLNGLDMNVNPADPNEIYVASERSVRYSNNGGVTFTNITTGLNTSSGSRISLAIAPSQPNRIYALVCRAFGLGQPDEADFYTSTDRGATWQQRQSLESGFFGNQGFYNNCLVVHPTDPDVVVAGGVDLYRTSNGGNSWFDCGLAREHWWNPNAVHPDQHALQFDPLNPHRLYLGNDGGLYVSQNDGMDWTKVTTRLPITQFYKMDVDQGNVNRVYGGTQDNGSSGSIGLEGDPKQWTMLSGGDGFFMAVDPYRPNIVYSEIYYGSPIYMIDIRNPFEPTEIDGGILLQEEDFGDWATPLVISRLDGRLYSGREKLWRTSNMGGTWQRLTPGNTRAMSAVGLSRTSSSSEDIIIGTVSGEMFYTTNDGASWAASTGTPKRAVSDLRYDPVKPGRVYATFSGFGSGHIFRSEDHGATFTDISGNLPNTPVNALAIDAADNRRLFVGTDAGAFVTLDGGNVWVPFNEGLPLAPVVDLKIHDVSRTLIAATHGRSMFKINISSVQPAPVMIHPVGGESFPAPEDLEARWFGLSGEVRVLISYDGGRNYDTATHSTTGSSFTIDLPLVKTTMAVIRVEEIATGTSITSEPFSLIPVPNGLEQNRRGFVAEAVEARRGYLWATVRDSDSLYKLRLPSLTLREGLVRTGIPGRIRDLAYDAAADRFYALVTENDFSSPRIFRMDSNGVGRGELTLPAALTHANGIAMVPGGLGVITPGTDGEIFTIDDAGTLINRSATLRGTDDADRRGLAWDGAMLVQGVLVDLPDAWFPSQLQRLTFGAEPSVQQKVAVVLPNVSRLEFFGLAYDAGTEPGQQMYYATDTSGAFFRFTYTTLFSGVGRAETPEVTRPAGLLLKEIAPNPFRSETRVIFEIRDHTRRVTLDIFRENGARMTRSHEMIAEPGQHEILLDANDLPSGVYYVVLSDESGERDVRPVVVVK